MSNDDLNTLLSQFSRALFDPTAPLPTLWPVGAMGVFLVFVTQIGAGIPLAVIMARNAGIPIPVTALLYLASDVVLALITEPMLTLLRWLGQRVEFIGRLGNRLARFSGAAGLQGGGVRGPLGLIFFSFTLAPAPARAASEAAGHGPISGWTLAIIGDMVYFAMVMASTLWVTSTFGDSRTTVGAVMLGAWLVPMLIRRMRRGSSAPAAPPPQLAVVTATTQSITPRTRKAVSHNGRRHRSARAARQ
jgi:hypothetical protein